MTFLRTAALLASTAALSACALLPNTPSLAPLPLPDIEYEKFVLDNGLTLIVHEDRKTPIIAVNVWYHVGSKNEPKGRTGFAHLFEHLMFNGSENFNDEFFRPLEKVGATGMNGTTNADRTNYFANVPTESLDTLLWLESDRMGHLLGAIDQAKLDEQRGVVQNEKRQGENQPYGRVRELLPKYSYPEGHPYSWSTIGSMDDLNAATLDDVKDWFKTWYGAANAVIVVAGDIDAQTAKAKVEQYFGHIPAGPQLSRPQAWPAPMPANRFVSLEDQVPHARSYLVWNVAPNYSEDLIYLQTAADVLAGGKTSRLYKKFVHDEQTATGVGAWISPRELGSQFIVSVTAKPGEDIAALEQQVRTEVERMMSQGVDAQELERSRTGLFVGMLQGLQKVGGFGGKSDVLASSQVLTGRADAWRDELGWLRDATPDKLQASLKQWLSYGHLTVRVTPAAKTKTSAQDVDRSRLPQSGPAQELELPPMQRATLSNGVEVVLLERHDLPLLNLQLITRAGYAADPKGKEGLANLSMGLLDEGTQHRSALEIAGALEELGAQVGSWASLSNLNLSLSTVNTRFPQALEIFSEIALQPSFAAEELERLRPRLIAGIAQEKARPYSAGIRVLPPLLFGEDHPHGRPLTGSGHVESLKSITHKDVLGFYQDYFAPQNSQFLVVGAMSMAELLPQLEAHFGQWENAQAAAPPVLPPRDLAQSPRIFVIDQPGKPQTLILAGHLAPPVSDADNLKMRVASEALGGLFTSRLNMNLREDKHWAYGAGNSLFDIPGQRPYIVYGSVQADKTVAAMQEIDRELRQIKHKRPLTQAELDAVVRNETLSLPGKNETLGQLASSVSRLLKLDLPDDYYQQFVRQMNAMTLEQAQTGAQNLIQPDAMTWVLIGDVAPHLKALQELGWGPVQTLQDN